ncbi:MAG: hypothetical protein KBC96_05680 [Armatimonadetes bacterium]|nr:hypothetical protein [Armatimonadota bacterium]
MSEPRVRRALKSGNGVVHEVTWEDGRWVVRFLSEPRTSPQSLWFSLEADNLQGKPVRFVWMNADHTLGNAGALGNIRPVLRVSGGGWMRCLEVEVVTADDGRLELAFEHNRPSDRVAVAFCYPYCSDHFQLTLDETRLPAPATIGITGQGRPLPRLRLPGSGGAGVYLMARQHAGETPGSWVLDGLIRALAKDGPGEFDWWIVPFVDLDGVENGDYGKDAHPWDFNRAWEKMPMRPEVLSIQADLHRFASRYPKRLLIDLHAPGHAEDGLWVFMPRSHRPAAQRVVSESIASVLASVFTEVEASELKRETNYASRWGVDATFVSWAWDRLDHTPAASIETSYQSFAGRRLDIDGYRDIGRRLVSAFEAYSDRDG